MATFTRLRLPITPGLLAHLGQGQRLGRARDTQVKAASQHCKKAARGIRRLGIGREEWAKKEEDHS